MNDLKIQCDGSYFVIRSFDIEKLNVIYNSTNDPFFYHIIHRMYI